MQSLSYGGQKDHHLSIYFFSILLDPTSNVAKCPPTDWEIRILVSVKTSHLVFPIQIVNKIFVFIEQYYNVVTSVREKKRAQQLMIKTELLGPLISQRPG
jgi:hypothetical protein